MDTVSIITTYYNASDLILNAVNSISQQQTDDDVKIEYILVDDKSPDLSTEKVKEFYEKHVKNNGSNQEWKFFEPEENLGCGGARRFGIEHATGDYFMFLDADDYYMNKDFVKRAYHTLIDEDADIVEFGILFNSTNGKRIPSVVDKVRVITTPHQAELALFRDNAIKFNVWSKIYRRSIVESYQYSDTRQFEDVRTIPHWIANAKKIVIMPSVEVNYRAAANSIIRDNVLNTRLGTVKAIAEHFLDYANDFDVLKAMYGRAMIDLEATMSGKNSSDPGFLEMNKLNAYMLSFLYPKDYKTKVYLPEENK
jgi:glycosyltransferase involved in cell wall biosynthesis